MIRSEEERERRRAELAERAKGGTRRGGGTRFVPLNALVDGGWLGALTHRELKVWDVLFRMADGSGRATVSHGRIARDARIRREDAARTTKRLEHLGLVRVRVRGRTVGQAGKRTANVYELLVPKPRTNSGDGATIEEDE
jgi:hypothetical protein